MSGSLLLARDLPESLLYAGRAGGWLVVPILEPS